LRRAVRGRPSTDRDIRLLFALTLREGPMAAGRKVDAYSRELRIAPVMTGGTSLAVWMGGVTAELYRVLTACEEDVHAHPSMRIYQELLELTRTTPRVDVITGTSAGGLNGSVLAAAWYLRLPVDVFMQMRSIWLNLGDLAELLRSPNESNPPSLLRGDDYFASHLRDELTAWSAYKRDGDFRPLDLLVTVTTVHGEPKFSFDDFGQKIGEVGHRHHLQFVCSERPERDDFKGNAWIAQLATASRTSASIPAVFEPSFLVVDNGKDGRTKEQDLGGRPVYRKDQASFSVSRWAVDGGVTVNLPLGEAIDRIFRQPASEDLRRVVLYVKPTPDVPPEAQAERSGEMPTIAQALQTIGAAPRAEGIAGDIARIREHNRQASRQRIARLARMLLTSSGGSLPEEAGRIWPAFVMLRSAKSVELILADAANYLDLKGMAVQLDVRCALRAPRAAVMPKSANDLEAVGDASPWGWGISALEYGTNVAMGLLGTAFDLPRPNPVLDPADARTRDPDGVLAAENNEAGECRARLEPYWAALHALLARIQLMRALDDAFWEDRVQKLESVSDQSELDRWAADAYREWPFKIDADGNVASDQPDGIRRALDALHSIESESRRTFGQGSSAAATNAVLRYLRDLGIELGRTVGDIRDDLTSLALVTVRPVMRAYAIQPDPDHPLEPLQDRLSWSVLYPSSSDALPALAMEIIEPVLSVLGQLQNIARLPDGSQLRPEAQECLQNLLRLHVLDTVNQGQAATNEQILELLQVSWDAPNELDHRPPASKLAGTELNRLGAFLKRSWRANDWMWGRLDGSQRMIVMLLDPKRLRQLRLSRDDVYHRINKMMKVRIAGVTDPCPATPETEPEGFPGDVWGDDDKREVCNELAFLDDDKIPTPRSLPRCIAMLSYALQTMIVQEELPYLHDAIVVNEREGGAEGDNGAFRVLYRRKVRQNRKRDGTIDDEISTADAPELLRAVRIGDEHAADEIGNDLFTRTATQAAAVVVKAATGEHAGMKLAARVARPLRLPTTVLYALGRLMTMRSRTAVGALALALAVSGAILGLRIADKTAVYGPLVSVAALVFLAALGIALLRSRLWTAIPAFLAAVVIVLAVGGTDVSELVYQDGPLPLWKQIIFTDTWSISFVLVLLVSIVLYIGFIRAVVNHWRLKPTQPTTPEQWATIDRRRYGRLFRRGVWLLLVVPVTLLAWQWLMKQFVTGTKGNEPVKDAIFDTAKWLQKQELWVVALTLGIVGALIGIGYDRTLSLFFSRAGRAVRGLFAKAGPKVPKREAAPDQQRQRPLPHPYSRLTSARRWVIWLVSTVAVAGLAFAMHEIGGSVPQLHENFHVSRPGPDSTVYLLLVDYPFMLAYGLALSLTLAFFASVWSRHSERADNEVAKLEKALPLDPASDDPATADQRAKVRSQRFDQEMLRTITIWASMAAWLPLAAAAADSFENAFLLGYLGMRPAWTANVARAASTFKWVLLGFTAVVLIMQVVRWFPSFCRRVRRLAGRLFAK
jgi:patatin-related protein